MPEQKTSSNNAAQLSRARRTITCPHYAPPPGRKRCRHYLNSGACERPDEFMCVEWLKANGPQSTAVQGGCTEATTAPQGSPTARVEPKVSEMRSPDSDLFGQRMPEPNRRPRPTVLRPAAVPCPVLYPEDTEPPVPPPGLTAEAIERFKSQGCIAGLDSDTFGSLWVVPEYTGHDRPEISLEHAATLHHVLQVFPGSQLVSFETGVEPEPKQETNQSKES